MTSGAERKEKKKKGFISKILDKLDKNLEEKAKKAACCGDQGDGKGGKSCC